MTSNHFFSGVADLLRASRGQLFKNPDLLTCHCTGGPVNLNDKKHIILQKIYKLWQDGSQA
jgi:hypothetical protein